MELCTIWPIMEYAKRASYEESCRVLQKAGWLDEGKASPMPARVPGPLDDGPLGVSFFRTFVGDINLENLTLPRTFFGR
jgi:BTB/POZ domain-containing protein KCTD9